MTLPYTYISQGRRPATVITVLVIWAALITALVLLEAEPLILAVIGAFTLPALYDLVRNPHSTLTLDETHLRWTSGRQDAEIALSEIDHLRFDTRLDMSVRLTVVRPSGVKVRVPFPATPPHATFEPLARSAGLTTRRYHFSLIG
ncbi:hypothetical protein [uncultured Sulfitobacter sp.]|uniref:hypothetical protein n=1 Tax=uncultured Sulfitobacter sp. TaxID=191468 RepID=UPI002627A288|nr:hypothetical protein [uncultured Sulfitobacter sp.]